MKLFRPTSFFLLNSLFFLSAHAIPNTKDNTKIVFNYEDMTLSTVGVYNPKIEGEKTGLHAELIARKNGIDNLEKYFESSCEGLDKSSLDVKNEWENNFHSLGTEIYYNGVLTVTLRSPIKQIFKLAPKTKKNIRTDDGERIVFQIPDQIPNSAIRCGTMEIDLGDNHKMHIFPIDSVAKKSSSIKIVHLVFDATSSNLKLDPKTKEADMETLDYSTLADIEDISSEILPITVSASSINE